ncbi:MAG: hypothetical protein A2342_09690 [Gallionellales bacterium RIFOXYB12_FULL_54_9]|nr:MAG: hypothetical protein A2342_09690 [Gallionellales bacterium RIFOXYB12_FULL_54_9]
MKFKLLCGTLLLTAGHAVASGFALIEQSGSGMGNAYAGGAASAEDAATVYFNPAGMSRLKGRQVAAGGSLIGVSTVFSDAGSSPALGRPTGSAPGNVGGWSVLPNAYVTMALNDRAHIGLGINAPFGMKTDYTAGWTGRFQAMKSSIETINLNPSLSYQVSDALALGVGISYQQLRATLSNVRSFGGAGEGVSTMSGSGSDYGANAGVLLDLGGAGRLGVAYRSAIGYKLNGAILVTSPLGVPVLSGSAVTYIKMPSTLSFSYFRELGNRWDVMADLTRTGWSSIPELVIASGVTGVTLSRTPENWRDTWRASLGGNYHYSEQWTARMGLAYDQSPVVDAYRTARVPDADRTWLALGGQYKPDKNSALDFGYAHLFVKAASINNNTGAAGLPSTATVGRLLGSYASSVDIFSVQYALGF